MEPKKERCPHATPKNVSDDEALDHCEENEDRLCLLETGEECETYNEILKEWEEEEKCSER